MKERETIDVRIILLPTKSNVLRYADLNSFYATRDLIDHKGLIERIERLSKNLSLSKRYSHIAEQITDIVSCDPDFIPNRIYNLAPAIIYLVVRLYKLPTTRRSIAIAAKVSEPSLTKLCRLRKHNKK